MSFLKQRKKGEIQSAAEFYSEGGSSKAESYGNRDRRPPKSIQMSPGAMVNRAPGRSGGRGGTQPAEETPGEPPDENTLFMGGISGERKGVLHSNNIYSIVNFLLSLNLV